MLGILEIHNEKFLIKTLHITLYINEDKSDSKMMNATHSMPWHNNALATQRHANKYFSLPGICNQYK